MQTLSKMVTLVEKDCWLMSINFSDTYFSIGIALIHHKLLKFVWKRQIFQFVTLPFGLSKAPRKWTKLMKAPLALIKQNGYAIATYLDDLLQAEWTRLLCKQALNMSYNFLLSLGFLPNHYKSVYIPTQ